MPMTDNNLGKRIRGGVAIAAVSLGILALVLAYYAWSYGPIDYLAAVRAGHEPFRLKEAWAQTARRFAITIDEYKGQLGVFTDFLWHYQPAGVTIYSTGLPPNKYVYSAFFALCMAPLGRMCPQAAVHAWAWIQLAAIALLVLVPGVYFARRSRRDYYLYLALTLLSLPVLHNLMWGQVSTPLTVCMLGALCLYLRGGRVGAAALLALATSIKFYPGILAIYFLLKRDFRLLAMFAGWTITLLVLVPAVRLGVKDMLTFQQASSEALQQVHRDALADYNSQYLPHVLKRYLNAEDTEAPGPRLLYAGAWTLFALNLLLLWGIIRAGLENHAEAGFALLLLSIPLVVETSWPHYFTYLPFCQVVAWRLLDRRRLDALSLLQCVLLAESAVLSSSVFFNLLGRYQDYGWYGCLLWSDLLLILLLYVQTVPRVIVALRARPAQPGKAAAPAKNAPECAT